MTVVGAILGLIGVVLALTARRASSEASRKILYIAATVAFVAMAVLLVASLL
jgi:sulfite exporter TauE/SafE